MSLNYGVRAEENDRDQSAGRGAIRITAKAGAESGGIRNRGRRKALRRKHVGLGTFDSVNTWFKWPGRAFRIPGTASPIAFGTFP